MSCGREPPISTSIRLVRSRITRSALMPVTLQRNTRDRRATCDWRPIRTLPLLRSRIPRTLTAVWDGRDAAGTIVPDEAYTIAVFDRTTKAVIYDPASFSGGEFGDIEHVQLDRTRGNLSYSLSAASRVLFRVGMKSSDHLRTVVNLEPRAKGRVVEYWNGKDSSGLIDLLKVPASYMVISYYSLPVNSVISFGNRSLTYATYKPVPIGMAIGNPKTEQSARKISPLFFRPRSTTRDFSMGLLIDDETASSLKALPVAKKGSLLRVVADEATQKVLEGRQFEIMFYFDHQFFAESERGYLPFNMPLDPGTLSAGEHLLTINVTTYDGLSGLITRKIRIEK